MILGSLEMTKIPRPLQTNPSFPISHSLLLGSRALTVVVRLGSLFGIRVRLKSLSRVYFTILLSLHFISNHILQRLSSLDDDPNPISHHDLAYDLDLSLIDQPISDKRLTREEIPKGKVWRGFMHTHPEGQFFIPSQNQSSDRPSR